MVNEEEEGRSLSRKRKGQKKRKKQEAGDGIWEEPQRGILIKGEPSAERFPIAVITWLLPLIHPRFRLVRKGIKSLPGSLHRTATPTHPHRHTHTEAEVHTQLNQQLTQMSRDRHPPNVSKQIDTDGLPLLPTRRQTCIKQHSNTKKQSYIPIHPH